MLKYIHKSDRFAILRKENLRKENKTHVTTKNSIA